MRYLTVLPVLLATALAKEDTQAQSPASNSSEKDPTPIGQLWAAKWQDADLTPTYSKNCHSNTAYKAQLYSLGEIYPTLKDWAPQLKVFYHKQLYPGAWEGEDVHGDGRMLLKMGVEELPGPVREWLTQHPKQRHFNVQEDVVFFAPGAIYPIAPLWVEEPAGESKGALGECEGVFEDLENYSAMPKDGVVLGRVTHEMKGKNEVEFKVEAFQIKKKGDAKDEL